MVTTFYLLFIVVSVVVSFGWSWVRLLDFNNYYKPFLEGTLFSYLILVVGSVWWISLNGVEEGLIGVFYYFLVFLVTMIVNGTLLAYRYSKKR